MAKLNKSDKSKKEPKQSKVLKKYAKAENKKAKAENKKGREKSHLSDITKAKIIIAVIAVIIIANIFVWFYSTDVGNLQTQTISNGESYITKEVTGVAIRDESTVSAGYYANETKNTSSPLIKASSKSNYGLVVDDGDYVSYNQTIAYAFGSKKEQKSFNEYRECKAELEMWKKLKNAEEGEVDIDTENLELTEILGKYSDYIKGNSFSTDFSEYLDEIIEKISLRDDTLNIDSSIEALQNKLDSFSFSYSVKDTITSPSAGYFVDEVDGMEDAYSFSDISEDGIKLKKLRSLMKSVSSKDEDYLGKIVYRNEWYFSFEVPYELVGQYLKKNTKITVSFPSSDINNVTMTVSSINRSGDNAAVTCVCYTVDENILHLRVEDAVLNLKKLKGYKVSPEALETNGKIQGVYVNVGSRAVFKPVKVLYSTEDYIIIRYIGAAEFVKLYGIDELRDLISEATLIANQEKIDKCGDTFDEDGELNSDLAVVYNTLLGYNNRVLKNYDKVIVKGRNLYDGKFIS